MKEVRYYNSKSKIYLLILGSALLFFGSLLVAQDKENFYSGMGWIGVVFFTFTTIFISRGLFNEKTVVLIDKFGIEDKRLGIGLIKWDDIKKIRHIKIGLNDYLSFELFDEEKYLSNFSFLKKITLNSAKTVGLDAISINFTGLKPNIDNAIKYISNNFKDKLK